MITLFLQSASLIKLNYFLGDAFRRAERGPRRRFLALNLISFNLIYGCTLVMQTSASLYYLTRRTHLLGFLRETPEWVVQTLKVAA